MTHTRFLLYSFIALLSCIIVQTSHAQTTFANKHLAEMMEDLLPQLPSADVSGELSVVSLCPSHPIIIEQDSNRKVEHIGLKLFDRALLAKHPSPLYRFVERYLLELLLCPGDERLETKLKLERIQLSSELQPLVHTHAALRSILKEFPQDPSIYIHQNNNRNTFTCTSRNRTILSIEFPTRFELITGQNKPEAEEVLLQEIGAFRPQNTQTVDEKEFSSYQDSLYLCNEDYYMKEDIVSTSYYRKSGDEYQPLFTPLHPAESIYNLFNSDFDFQIGSQVNYKQYKGSVSSSLALHQLVGYFKSQQCTFYTGIKKMGKEKIEGVALAINYNLGYQHILLFTTDKEILRRGKELPVKITLYSYVPIHNVATLFDK